MKCKDCKYCFELERLTKQYNECRVWELKSVCVMFPITKGEGYENFAMVVDKEEDECEAFERRTK